MSMATSTAAMAAAAAAMPLPTSSSRSSDHQLINSFNLPNIWGPRRTLGFCKELLCNASEPQTSSSSPEQETVHLTNAPATAPPEAAPPPAPAKHWNLRDRKAARGGRARDSAMEEATQQKRLRLDGGAKSRLSVSLSRQEIEKDFMEITGRKPPRRPKKRPKNVQRQIDTLQPGFSISEVHDA